MATNTQRQISTASSTATLDIHDILSSVSADTLLSTRLSLSSSLDSSHSFDNSPPFQQQSHPLILNHFGPSAPFIPVAGRAPRPLVTSPTGPRLKKMMMEKLSVHAWATSLPVSSGSPASLDGVAHNAAVETVVSSARNGNPGSSTFSEATQTKVYGAATRLPLDAGNPSAENMIHDSVALDYVSPCVSTSASSSSDIAYEDFTPPSAPLLVPTITVSNSSAALPSLDSSHNIQHDGSIAARRGKKPPPSLTLSKSQQASRDDDPYPDIPSAFLGGSPTCQSPTFDFSSDDPSKFNMGLSAMCNSLKALVPPLTPTDGQLPPRPRRGTEPRWGMVVSAQLPEVDEEEWAFTQELVVDWHASRGISAEISPPPSPAGELPYAGDTPSVTDVFAQLLPSPPSDSSQDNVDEEDAYVQPPTSDSVKHTRRKTVIIQAPAFRATSVELPSLEKPGKRSPAAERTDLLSDEFHEPVPFETPSSLPAPSSALSLASSRPSSTASGKTPVRGILKEKKSVRFSSVPSLHEFTVDTVDRQEHSAEHETDEIPPRPMNPAPGTSPQYSEPTASPVSSLRPPTATPHRSSPLRNVCSSADNQDETLRASPTRIAAHTFMPGNTMAKHPAVRAMARRPQPRPSLLAPGVFIPSGQQQPYSPKAPTSALLEAQRRAPLRSINARLNMPIERKEPLIPIPVRTSSPSKQAALDPGACVNVKENVIGDVHQRAQRTAASVAASPLSARSAAAAGTPKRRSENNVSAAHKTEARGKAPGLSGMGAGAGGQKHGSTGSRMPVPLRSILTKLRT